MSLRPRWIGFSLIGAFLWVLISFGRCFAGAWTMPDGKLYERFSLNYYYADSQFSMDGSDSGFKKYADFNLGNYFEYGLTDRFTIVNSMYYKFIEKEDQSGTSKANGFADVDLALKGKLAEGSLGFLSAQTLVKIPGAYGKNDELPLGNGQYDFETRLLFGRSLYPLIPGYCNFEMGYRWRFGDPSDELRYLVEFGMDLTKSLYGRIKLDGILSMNNGTTVNSFGNPTATYNYDLGKLEIALGHKITRAFGIEICFVPEIYGRNTTSGTMYTVALTYQTN